MYGALGLSVESEHDETANLDKAYEKSLELSYDPLEEEEFALGLGGDVMNVQRLEAITHDELQDMEQTRANLVYYGEQFDILPHMRCFECGKVIGNKWEPYLAFAKEKYYKPEEVIELLVQLNEEQQAELLGAINDPIFFNDLLVEYDVKSDYDTLISQRKYTNKEIFDKMNLRPCCRLNLLSPIHVPIQQQAFKEYQKITEISDPVLDMSATSFQVSLSGSLEEESVLDPFEEDEITPLQPEIEPEVDMGECNIKTTQQIVSLSQLGAPIETIEDPSDRFGESLDEVGEATKRTRELVPVGEGYAVQQLPRKYRAR